MIRTILAFLLAGIYLILSLPILLVELIVRKFDPVLAQRSFLRIVQFVLKGIQFICGTKVTVKGIENLPEDEAVLFVGNHRSIFDVIITYSHMKDRTAYIAKNNLEPIPVLNWNMRFLSCLFLDRKDIKQGLQTILSAIELVKSGISVFIFPEGTRNKNEDETELLEFHRGSFKIAQRTGCKIIPVAINNTAEIFEKQFPRAVKRHVVVEYGTPVLYGELSREEQKQIDEHFRGVISGMLERNRAEV